MFRGKTECQMIAHFDNSSDYLEWTARGVQTVV